MLNRFFAVLLLSAVVFSGCSQPSEEPADAPEAPEAEAPAEGEAAEAPEAEAESEEAAAPAEEEAAEESIALPGALADLVVVSDDFTITKVDTLDADAMQYHIEADTKLNVDKVQEYFMGLYEGKGWTEDMNMSQKGNTVTSYSSPDGFLIFIEANKGGRGSEVSINTGKG